MEKISSLFKRYCGGELCLSKDCYVFSGIYKFHKGCSNEGNLFGISLGPGSCNSIYITWKYDKVGDVIELYYLSCLNSNRSRPCLIGTVELDTFLTLDISVGRSNSDHNILIILRAQKREPVVRSFQYNLPEKRIYLLRSIITDKENIDQQIDIAKVIHNKR